MAVHIRVNGREVKNPAVRRMLTILVLLLVLAILSILVVVAIPLMGLALAIGIASGTALIGGAAFRIPRRIRGQKQLNGPRHKQLPL